MKPLLVMVLNEILSMFNLEIVDNKLLYHHKLKFGSIDFYVADLTTTLGQVKLVEFLELPYIPSTNDVDDIYYAVTNSKYFTKRLFKHLKYPDERYRQFLNKIERLKPINLYRHTYIPGYSALVVDKFFGTHIIRSVRNIDTSGLTAETMKKKFNGHLVQQWVPDIKPGRDLVALMEEFGKFITEEFRVNFVDYLLNRPEKLIRKDFINYYYNEVDYFDRMFLEDELPF